MNKRQRKKRDKRVRELEEWWRAFRLKHEQGLAELEALLLKSEGCNVPLNLDPVQLLGWASVTTYDAASIDLWRRLLGR